MRLQLDGISKAFRDGASTRHVLDGLDVDFGPGGVTAVLGPSGVGKSTLLAIAGGLSKPDEGTVRFLTSSGRSIPIGYRNVSWILQTTNLLHSRTVLDNVAVALLSDGSSREVAERIASDALEIVGVGHLAAILVSRLSGGERQRVAVARALVRPSGVILADEPTAQLDRSNAEKVAISLGTAARNHIVVVASHDPIIAEHATTVLKLRDGRLWAGD